jgi:hypothetical protein
MRFSHAYRLLRSRASSFSAVLQSYPLSLRLVRGIDVCTDELGIPLWVITPLFRHLRRTAQTTARFLSLQLGISTPPLRATAHAGEDHVHLLDGLRRVDEAIVRLGLEEGDRLGHAIALGIDATHWCTTSGRVPLTKETRLLDLIWEWVCYCRRGVVAPEGRIASVEHEARALAAEILDEPVDMLQLERTIDLLYDSRALQAVGFPDGIRTERAASEPMRSLSRLLSDPGVFRRGQGIVWVETAPEASALEVLQFALRSWVAARGIAIEINPSSNLLIGNLCDLTTHPLWRLSSMVGAASNGPDLTLCVGSDDPLTFATTTREEYAMVEDALRRGGKSLEVARSCVDQLREAGMSHRFTLPWVNGAHRIRSLPWSTGPFEPIVP